MSHIHIPDGVLPAWIILAGWALTGLLLVLVTRRMEAAERRRLPLLGMVSALMLVGMTVELVPIGYHINLSVIAGILLGPALAFLAAFVVDLILALFGHGGITVVGLNTLVIGAEAALGYYAFRAFSRLLGQRASAGLRAGLATALSLLLSTLLMIGLVAVSTVNPGQQAPHATAVEVEPDRLVLRNPLGEGLVVLELQPVEEEARALDLATFARLVLALGAVGWTLEAVLTGLIVGYVRRLRPDLLEAGARERDSAP